MSALTCAEFVELVTEYLDGAMDPAAARRFEAHLRLCPGCETYLEQIRQVIGNCGAVAEQDLSPAARDSLLTAFRDWHAGPGTPR